MPNAVLKWLMQSLYGELDVLRRERVGARRVATQWCKKPPIAGIIPLLVTIPGIGPITARTLVAWIADPRRFPNRAKIGSYSGLGLGQGVPEARVALEPDVVRHLEALFRSGQLVVREPAQ